MCTFGWGACPPITFEMVPTQTHGDLRQGDDSAGGNLLPTIDADHSRKRAPTFGATPAERAESSGVKSQQADPPRCTRDNPNNNRLLILESDTLELARTQSRGHSLQIRVKRNIEPQVLGSTCWKAAHCIGHSSMSISTLMPSRVLFLHFGEREPQAKRLNRGAQHGGVHLPGENYSLGDRHKLGRSPQAWKPRRVGLLECS